MIGRDPAPFVFIIAGEPSGDTLGAALIRALRERTGAGLRVAGIGGEQMREEGVDSLVPLSELAVAGLDRNIAACPATAAPNTRDRRGDPCDAAGRGRHDRQLRAFAGGWRTGCAAPARECR